MFVSDLVKQQLAPRGVLRAGINLSNFLLVSGTAADGSPTGISPDIANLVASTLDLPCELVCFDRPGKLADAINQDIWDIGNIAFEAERAQTLDFSHPYVVIEANFLVRYDDNFLTNDDIDRAGTKIAVSERSAYDLWLTDHFSQPQIIRASSIQAAHDLFFEKKVDVLASLKPKLLEDMANHSGVRIIDPSFTAVKQSIGLAKGKAESIAFINTLIAQSIKNGWIAAQLELHGMTGKLGIDPH
ncbi:transporter substrate-binding domain-containing protein [Alphaproteobacteria bacterium]|jgi:polar amino acid transport system substrate-binding protein|nr:transporter substrate-binding domain-containing protein [Alphaproteobacteria bacterium]MDB4599938.1 transporter substrate-binding domain-containing protein [Alphaproteobacteria bacterium]|tara:strand:+ start:168 stop:899 length:732 start_codon:yes stop_codon:yes gene_type:complete